MKIDESLYIGKRFGKLVILDFVGRYRDGTLLYECQCDCGNKFYAKMRGKGNIRQSCHECYWSKFSKIKRKHNPRIFIEINGNKYSIKEISQIAGISIAAVKYRLMKWEKNRLLEPSKNKNLKGD